VNFFGNAPCTGTGFALILRVILLAGSLLFVNFVQADFDHASWDALLRKHVRVIDGGSVTQVDYAGMAQDASELDSYLAATAAVTRLTFDSWVLEDQLAFLINVYNAATVALILTEYPDLESIRDIGNILRSPWGREFVSLFGGSVTLDNIEHDMIRGWNIYNEPRIHFAVNCAAIGCPPLRAEAYVGNKLQQQLDDNTRLFLSDGTRNYLQGDRLYVSQIFNWYEEDFTRGWQGIDSVEEFLALYGDALGIPVDQQGALQQGEFSIRYLRYDWGLNRAR